MAAIFIFASSFEDGTGIGELDDEVLRNRFSSPGLLLDRSLCRALLRSTQPKQKRSGYLVMVLAER